MEIVYRPIGRISTSLKDKGDAPIQGVFAPESMGRVELFPEYAGGLKDVEGFSHLILIYHFHRSRGWTPLKKPFLDDVERGIFSIRHYDRPNPIGISVVRLLSVDKNVLEVCEVDILDGTPLLDIKPYVPRFDVREDAVDGWLGKADKEKI
ncbi:MAG: tRNA (N6-threonylcarbamoyladenosine(37)-N6)-methyltransferase TrmO [Deltaproteobacteria bacterium]|uniref:tRNA (N6-threonylcarbamoyladenosine(37)-N6)-methyltransferase TrmO n=1 Tax=Candidatus Zymogenus saltonus TaxID=2844893 RepID=A0A9D8KH07_9DELT|nr:tRNA (N6-threonylcarbamoyladenosine(37)-N6)-methyltransferase TrmO [Candidatus Zymogenus saltonus]